MTIVDRQFSRKPLMADKKQARSRLILGDCARSIHYAVTSESRNLGGVATSAITGIVDRQFHHKPFGLEVKLELVHG